MFLVKRKAIAVELFLSLFLFHTLFKLSRGTKTDLVFTEWGMQCGDHWVIFIRQHPEGGGVSRVRYELAKTYNSGTIWHPLWLCIVALSKETQQ